IIISVAMFFLILATTATENFSLSLHDALPICKIILTAAAASTKYISLIFICLRFNLQFRFSFSFINPSFVLQLDLILTQTKDLRSEEHTSELQSRFDLVCRLLLEKKKNQLQQK